MKMILGLCLTAYGMLFAAGADAGQFSISPMTIDIEKGARSGSLSIGNEDKVPLQFQIKASAWTQDSSGKDVYGDTDEVVFYPKMLRLNPGEQRVVRIGMKGRAPEREKTYRLFIEEVPTVQAAENIRKKAQGRNSAMVTVVMRIAPPIFFEPAIAKTEAAINALSMENGAVKVRVANTGNVHIKLSAIKLFGKAEGRQIFHREIPGWYVLSGASRVFETTISAEECRRSSVIEVDAEGEALDLKGSLDVRKESCPE